MATAPSVRRPSGRDSLILLVAAAASLTWLVLVEHGPQTIGGILAGLLPLGAVLLRTGTPEGTALRLTASLAALAAVLAAGGGPAPAAAAAGLVAAALPDLRPKRCWSPYAAFLGVLLATLAALDGRCPTAGWLDGTLSSFGGTGSSVRWAFVALLFLAAGTVRPLALAAWSRGKEGLFREESARWLAPLLPGVALLMVLTGLTRGDSPVPAEVVAHHLMASGFALAFGAVTLAGPWLFPEEGRAFRWIPAGISAAVLAAWAPNLPYLLLLAERPAVPILWVESAAFAWIVVWGGHVACRGQAREG